MSEATMLCKIITPEQIAFEGQVQFVSAKALDGEIGIYPHHAALLAGLVAGRIEITDATKTKQIFTIGTGFMEVVNNETIITTTSCTVA